VASVDAGLKRELEAKVYEGVRLTRADGEALYASDDLAWLGRLAHHKRTELNGGRVMFNVNRHLNLTNVCSASCAYCSFQRKPGEKDAYTMRVEEAVRIAHRQRPASDTAVEVLPPRTA
jgi:aminodeoxyfutalosine synthase